MLSLTVTWRKRCPPAELHSWFQTLDLAPITKGHIRSLMHKLFDFATLWEYLPLERRNPIELVNIRNVTKRQKEAVALAPEQFRDVIRRLPAHVNMSDHHGLFGTACERSAWPPVAGY